MTNYFQLPMRRKPGLFITAIDTGMGKTVLTCAIAEFFARLGQRVGVSKPFSTGCRTERGQLVSPDAEALAHFSQFDPAIGSLGVVAPVACKSEAAPAVSSALSGQHLDVQPIARSFSTLDEQCDVVLVEGVGGLMNPVDPDRAGVTLLDLARELGYPVVVVTKANHASLNHTAMTCSMLRHGMCRIAGLVVNFYQPDNPDPSMQKNAEWLSMMNQVPTLATIPRMPADQVSISSGRLHDDIRAAVVLADWRRVVQPPAPPAPPQGGQWITTAPMR